MKRSLPSLIGSALAFTLLLGLGQGLTTPAEAGDWYVAGGFRVGGVAFSVAYDRHRHHHRPYYYYRTGHQVRYDNYRCGSYCFKRKRSYHHHPTCPLVLHHFRRNHFHPAEVWDHVRAPRYRGRYGYYDRYRSQRYHPYDYYRDHHRNRYRGYDRDYDSDSDSY